MSFSDFKAKEKELQEAFALISSTHTVKLAPISGTDMFYTDGSAMNYTGKIVVVNTESGLDAQWYFTPSGPVDHFPKVYDACFRKWIASVVAVYGG